jgi:hypothetical protein
VMPCFSKLAMLADDSSRFSPSYDMTLLRCSLVSEVEPPKLRDPIRSNRGDAIRDNIDVDTTGLGRE